MKEFLNFLFGRKVLNFVSIRIYRRFTIRDIRTPKKNPLKSLLPLVCESTNYIMTELILRKLISGVRIPVAVRSQRKSEAVGLLESRVPVPLKAWMFVCVTLVRVSATSQRVHSGMSNCV